MNRKKKVFKKSSLLLSSHLKSQTIYSLKSLGLWDLWSCWTDSNLTNTHMQIKYPHLTTIIFFLAILVALCLEPLDCVARILKQHRCLQLQNLTKLPSTSQTPTGLGSGGLSVMSAVHAGVHKICAQYWDVWQNWSAELSYCVKSLSRTAIQELMIMHGIIIRTVLSDTA